MTSTSKLTVIMKPTHECNLQCRYCYIEDSAESGTMSTGTLKNSISKVIEYGNRLNKTVHFIWHGGEPLLMGTDFYTSVIPIQRMCQPKQTITNSIQTNGTLLNVNILMFLKQARDFHLGLSLDGPACFHNFTRPYKNGTGSFDNVWKAIEQLQTSGHHQRVGVIVILTKRNISKIQELYTFFSENKINVKINPLVKSGQARKNYDDLSISPVEYGKAMIQLFDMWFFEKEYGISISPLDLIMGNMITEIPFGCNFSKSCQNNFISIGPLGDVYPCGRFDGISSFKFGNINKDSLDTILASGVRQRLLARTSEDINGCNTCKFRTICNAGCMHTAYAMSGNAMQKDYYCSAYKMLFKHIKKALDAEIEDSLRIQKLTMKPDTQRCIVKIFGHKLVLDNIENPQLRKIVRQRCKAASLELCTQGGENHADHYDWNEYAEHGDAYNDYSDNHVDTTYSDHHDGYYD